MKKLTLSQWEEKYLAGPIERFDQKYQMFNRPGWDTEIRERLEDWSFSGLATEKPGQTLLDMALRSASSRATMIVMFNTYKPNPSSVSQAIRAALATSNPRRRPAATSKTEPVRIEVSDPQTITSDVKKVATYFGADLVGICRLDRRWAYSHTYEGPAPEVAGSNPGVSVGESTPQEIPEEFQYAVVMAFEEDYDLMKYFNSGIANVSTGMGYGRMAIANACLSTFIRNLGFKAIDCSTNDVALSIPMAMQAGLGDLGRNGLLITPKFGPRVRISKVLTDLPLVADSPIDFGVTEFCTVCQKCTETCPSQSIRRGERTTEPNNVSNAAGALKWLTNAETCRMYWARTKRSCTICVASCPYNKVPTWPHRIVRWLTDNARWADSLYVKMDNWLGYGKPKKPDNFWEEWQPRRH